jgi:hypothetical protein
MRPSRRIRNRDPPERVLAPIRACLPARDSWMVWPGHTNGWIAPSSDETHRYYADPVACSCEARTRPCKHCLAVRVMLGMTTVDDIRQHIA